MSEHGHGHDDGNGHGDAHVGAPDERQHVWDNPRNVKLLFNVFYALCVILVVLGLIPRQEVPSHEGHPLEGFFAFYPLYGFVGIVVLVLIAKLMRRVLMRPEDYYDG